MANIYVDTSKIDLQRYTGIPTKKASSEKKDMTKFKLET